MNRKASVVWKGTLQEGTGTMSTESHVLSDTQYSYRTRFAKGFGKLFLLPKEQTKIIMRLIAVELQLRREAQMSERLEVIPLA